MYGGFAPCISFNQGHMRNIIYKTYKLALVAGDANTQVKPNAFQLPNDTDKVLGMAVTSNDMDKLYLRNNGFGLHISSDEIFEDDFPVKLLMPQVSTPPNQKFLDLGEVAPGNNEVRLRYTDKDHAGAAIGTGYTVYLTFKIRTKG